MKKITYFIMVLIFGACTASQQIFNNTITSGSHTLNLDTLAVNLATALSQNSIKYGFVLQHALYQTGKAGGLKRTAADPPIEKGN
jgi:hypothetical protein